MEKEDPGSTFDIQRWNTATYAWFNSWRSDETLKFSAVPEGDSLKLSAAAYAKYIIDG